MQTLTSVRPNTEDKEDTALISEDFVIGFAREDRDAIALNLPLAIANLRPMIACSSCGKTRSARCLYPKHVSQHRNSIRFSCSMCAKPYRLCHTTSKHLTSHVATVYLLAIQP